MGAIAVNGLTMNLLMIGGLVVLGYLLSRALVSAFITSESVEITAG